MIVLVATRLSVSDRFRYSVNEIGKLPHFTSENTAATVDELIRWGIGPDAARHYIAHANRWGSVEVPKGTASGRPPVD